MLKENLSNLILEALKSQDKPRLESLRAIKAAIQSYETGEKTPRDEKGNVLYDEATEINIIKGLVKQRKADAEIYEKAGRKELAEIELLQATEMEKFLPKAANIEEISAEFEKLCKTIDPIKKNMGIFVKNIKAQLPSADSKMVADLVKSKLV